IGQRARAAGRGAGPCVKGLRDAVRVGKTRVARRRDLQISLRELVAVFRTLRHPIGVDDGRAAVVDLGDDAVMRAGKRRLVGAVVYIQKAAEVLPGGMLAYGNINRLNVAVGIGTVVVGVGAGGGKKRNGLQRLPRGIRGRAGGNGNEVASRIRDGLVGSRRLKIRV